MINKKNEKIEKLICKRKKNKEKLKYSIYERIFFFVFVLVCSQRSEQLLRTLERLREETQSVAATLESMREHMATESHQIRGIFSNGNCIIAT